MKRKKTKYSDMNQLILICIYLTAYGCLADENRLPSRRFEPRSYSTASNEIGSYTNYNYRCFDAKSDNIPNLSLSNNKTIGIQVTNRPTHQIISRIFALYLREILEYQDIKFIPLVYKKHEELNKIVKTLYKIQHPDLANTPTIDLEVWTLPVFKKPENVEHTLTAGIVTSPGRFGLFVPTILLTNYNQTQLAQNLHYSLLMNPDSEGYQKFIINDINLQLIQNISTDNCCKEFIPPQCQNRTCATILSEHWEDTNFIEYQLMNVTKPLLYAKVIWLGPNLKRAIKNLFNIYRKSQINKKFLVLHWKPSDVINTDGIQYETFSMPTCNVYGDNYRPNLCKYELTPISKYYSQYFESMTNKITLKALERFHISGTELNELLTEFNENKSLDRILRYDQVACNWIQKKKKSEYSWVSNETKKIFIGGIFPLSTGLMTDVVAAVKLARDAINKNQNILPDIELIVHINDGACRSDAVMSSFITYHNMPTKVVGVLGPACSDTVEPIASISKIAGLPVISYAAEGASFNDRETYPYFFRTIGSNRQYEDVYIKLFKRFKWKRVAALTEDGQKYTEYITHMENLLKKNDIELILNKKFPKEASIDEMIRCLKDLKDKHAKIIIADIYNDNAQLVMCAAHKLQMTAEYGYVWFLPLIPTQKKIKNAYCTKAELSSAINGHFTLSHVPFAPNNSIMQENKTVGQWLHDSKLNIVSEYAGFAYDAVWVFALAAHKLWKQNPAAINSIRSPESVLSFVKNVEQLDFNGVSGRIRFGEGGSRITDVKIRQLVNNIPHDVGIYVPLTTDLDNKIINGTLTLNDSAIVWFSQNGQPKDGTFDCRLAWLAEFMNIDCDSSILYLAVFFGVIIIIVISLTSSLFWKQRYDKKMKLSVKAMKNLGIDLISSSAYIYNTLDKWEVSKDRVVMNRRLGEGAFGTVFGGEAQIDDAGWTAVAIKTLKMGSSSEDRLNFLSEAEAMKRFDHTNIIKLLGVCLKTEPIYTIMEFMLYGDLKTFLLARRHMVNEGVPDDSDISSKRLTMYSLDVARGLSYLCEQNYVHRDIACRNCLVNAQRVVKLADFGMARPMIENNYYRFNRTGLLPVRWMAPESLESAVFTPASDVWSFGVLLYEIITFGSFPYQGFTNNQVLEYVKNGKTLKIPENVKPHLQGLMLACWLTDPKKRPKASEIAEYISDHTSLLTPCLDVPIASVEMPETESDQMDLLSTTKKLLNKAKTIDILQQTSNLNNFDENSNKGVKLNGNETIEIPMEHLNVQPDNEEANINSNSPLLNDTQIQSKLSSSNNLSTYVNLNSSNTQNINTIERNIF